MSTAASRTLGRSLARYALLAALLPVPLFAQGGLRNLSGSVTDPQHEPLRGAVVQVLDGKTQAVVSYITDRSGRFSFKRLSRDTDYTVWATFRGQKSKTKALSQFSGNAEPDVELVIEPQ
jgi:hypothetical protein